MDDNNHVVSSPQVLMNLLIQKRNIFQSANSLDKPVSGARSPPHRPHSQAAQERQSYDPRCKSEHGHLTDISATALAMVIPFLLWKHTTRGLKRTKRTVLDPKCVWLKH